MPHTEPLNLVAVMDEMVYNALSQYYKVLKKTGYYKYSDVMKLLVLIFYRDFVYNDYRGYLSCRDYRDVERALNCLYGSTCLIPYPEYKKMGRLHLGEITEVVQRIKTLEDTDVLKPINDIESAEGDIDSDVIVVGED